MKWLTSTQGIITIVAGILSGLLIPTLLSNQESGKINFGEAIVIFVLVVGGAMVAMHGGAIIGKAIRGKNNKT